MNETKLILASGSPRRRELLARVVPAFDVEPCPYPEPQLRTARVDPRRWAVALACFKARAVAERHPQRWVLGADTLVACAGEILGKPLGPHDARRMLELQARTPSDVITGLCLLRRGTDTHRQTGCAVTTVWMRDDAAERETYLASGDWVGKAGAYGIQDVGDRLVAHIDGSFSNVVGLPVELLRRMLEAAGLPVNAVLDKCGGT